MTLEETKKFLHLVGLRFPNSMKHIKTNEDIELVASMWQANFKDVNAQDMAYALNEYVSRGVDVATPSLGQMEGDLKQILASKVQLPQLDSLEAWDKAFRSCSCNPQTARERFDKLPLNIRKALGSPSFLVSIGNANMDQTVYLKRDFIKAYENVLEEERTAFMLGNTNFKEIEYNNTGQLAIGTSYE